MLSRLNTSPASGSSHETSFAGSLRLRRATTQLRSRSWSRRQPSGELSRGRGERTSRRTSPSCAFVAQSARRATASFRSSRRTSEPCSSTHSSTLKGRRGSCSWTGRTSAAISAPPARSWTSRAAPRTTSAAPAPLGCALPERLRTSSPLSWATPTAGWWSGFTGGWSPLRSRNSSRKRPGALQQMLSRQSNIRWIWWTPWTLGAARLRVKWLPELGSNQRPTD